MATWMEIGPTENISQQAELIQIRYMTLEMRQRLQKQRSTLFCHQKRWAERKSNPRCKRKKEKAKVRASHPPPQGNEERKAPITRRDIHIIQTQHTGKVKVGCLISFDQKQSGLWDHSAQGSRKLLCLMNEIRTIGCLCTHADLSKKSLRFVSHQRAAGV